jgi:hypothetical protein
MIVDQGLLWHLEQLATPYAGLEYGLFTNNLAESQGTLFASLTEAAWTSYARVALGALVTPVIVGVRAVYRPYADPVFSNTSGSTQTFYGWFFIYTPTNRLIAYKNLGATTITNGGTRTITPKLTFREEV